ncbi:hypothetical protein ABWJ92_32025 [Streptomyces sp. NPDC000609]|uniref:hypothetical protein n=1 Tax=Streptomyces sp. NPDC000609 TaxID=3160957 RepID=UPI003394A95D
MTRWARSLQPGEELREVLQVQAPEIGVAHLADCHQDPVGTAPCSRWAQPDVFHVALADVQELALPIPRLRGQLGPWRLPQGLVDQVLRQLRRLSPEGAS